jgi:hypothetical protein
MLLLREPSTAAIRDFQATQSKLGFTYPAARSTATVLPAGYALDHPRISLETGESVFT